LRHGLEEGRSQERPEDHDEERQAGDPGHLPDLRRKGLQDRRLTRPGRMTKTPAETGGGLLRRWRSETRARPSESRSFSL
jgi:hypothetical protein